MAITSYSGLVEAVAEWAWRSGDEELEARVPDFIVAVESTLMNGAEGIAPLRVRDMEEHATITLTDGIGSLPDDYLQYRAVRDGGNPKRVLLPVDKSWGDSEYRSTAASVAAYFAIAGAEITTYPKSASNLSLDYYAKIPPLTADDPVNWLLTKAPNVYLYGCLMEAEAFSRDDQRSALWGQRFAAAVSGLRTADGMSKFARAVTRPRGPHP